jgi:hypothetical protein
LGTLLLAATLWMLRVARERDPVKREWDKLCVRLAKRGFERAAHEGPLDFAARAGADMARRKLPDDVVQALGHIAETYAALRYGPKPDKVAVARFQRLARRL